MKNSIKRGIEMLRSKRVVRVVFFVSLMFFITACRQEATQVYVSLVEEKPLRALVFANGEIVARDVEEVYVSPGTRIDQIFVQEGTNVNVGSRLFQDNANRTYASSIDGVVTHVLVKRGMVMANSEPAMTLMSTSTLEVEANVAQLDAAALKLNQPVSVMPEASMEERTLKGKVSGISKVATKVEGEVFVKVRIELLELPFDYLKPGMSVRCEIVQEEKSNALVMELDTMLQLDNERIVFVVENGKLQERIVQVGAMSGFDVEVRSGVNAGDLVVKNPMPFFRNNMPVSVLNNPRN